MIALVDCNSFFCSVEKVFHPGLNGKPVCVLSNNDGCIVALTPEAKALGLRRGDPIFKIKDIVEQHCVALFSTNMNLYAAMSKRVNHILRASVPRMDVYSIDESFLYLDGLKEFYNLEEYMRGVAEKVKLYTDIPVSVGIAPTKTLAKIGSKFAKQYKGYRSVCVIDNDVKRRKALELFDLADVWGIGRQTLTKLHNLGVYSPIDFAGKKQQWVQRNFTKPVVQTWMELNGIACIDTAEVMQRQSICTSRSFGTMVTDYDALRASVASFAASCANKLRGQQSLASTVTVFVASNRFRTDLMQYANQHTQFLSVATSDTIEITQAALKALQQIYRDGVYYKKAGVVLSGISDASFIPVDLFDKVKNRPQRMQLMKNIDELNHRFGVKKIHLAVEGEGKQLWHAKKEFRSGNYLSDIRDLMTIHI